MFEKIRIKGKAFTLALFFGLLCTVFISFADFNAGCEDLRSNVLRLHIIANSDSAEDQALKLKIRDRILESSGDIFENAVTVADAEKEVAERLSYLEEIANGVIAEEGFAYTVTAKIGNSFFETRKYETFTLPAGEYRSLIINLGDGKGKNWWCVIFPEICLPAAADVGLEKTVDDESAYIAEHPQRYIMRFKTVEIYEKIKNLFKN